MCIDMSSAGCCKKKSEVVSAPQSHRVLNIYIVEWPVSIPNHSSFDLGKYPPEQYPRHFGS